MAANGYWPYEPEELTTERATLAEWLRLQYHLVTFPSAPPVKPGQSWRSRIETLLHHSTQGQAHIHWKHNTTSISEGFDRWNTICWGKRQYGLLGLAPGYLASTLFADIPQQFADQCGLLLAVVEYQTVVDLKIRQLPPTHVIKHASAKSC